MISRYYLRGGQGLSEEEFALTLFGRELFRLNLLTAKFGPLPAETISREQGIASGAELDKYLAQAATSPSLDEVGL